MKKMKIIKTLASVAVLTVASNSAWAIGTAADTDIDNTAEITYSVGGTAQTEIESSEAGNSTPGDGEGTATTFKVDKKVDVLVTSGSTVNVVPGTTSQSITYTVQNQGNSDETFDFAATQVATGGSDTFDTTACTVTSPGTSAVIPHAVGPTSTVTVTVECSIPASGGAVVNGASSLLDLEATIGGGVTNDSGIPDSAGTVEVVFADDTGTTTDGADQNGSHSAVNTYTVNTAALTVAKTSAVTAMDINGASITTNQKRIPGATIQYSILVTNTAAEATHLVISDLIPSDLTYVASSCALTGDGIVNVVAPSPVLGCSESGGTVTSNSFTLPDGSGTATTATLTFDATVN